jgi:hypothetical protein
VVDRGCKVDAGRYRSMGEILSESPAVASWVLYGWPMVVAISLYLRRSASLHAVLGLHSSKTAMRKFCNITFVEEDSVGSNGERVKLLRCSRCSGVFYRGKEEQRRHWKTHKKVCQVTSPEEITRISHFTMDEAAVDLMQLLRTKNFLAGRKWTLLLPCFCKGYVSSFVRATIDQTVLTKKSFLT